MIYARGVVSFLSNNMDPLSIVKLNKKKITLEVIRKIPLGDSSGLIGKITCKFIVMLPRSYECKSLEDYTGKVKPFLQEFIKNVITSVEISHLNYSSSQAIDTKKQFE